jgi:hypothetical protein
MNPALSGESIIVDCSILMRRRPGKNLVRIEVTPLVPVFIRGKRRLQRFGTDVSPHPSLDLQSRSVATSHGNYSFFKVSTPHIFPGIALPFQLSRGYSPDLRPWQPHVCSTSARAAADALANERLRRFLEEPLEDGCLLVALQSSTSDSHQGRRARLVTKIEAILVTLDG